MSPCFIMVALFAGIVPSASIKYTRTLADMYVSRTSVFNLKALYNNTTVTN